MDEYAAIESRFESNFWSLVSDNMAKPVGIEARGVLEVGLEKEDDGVVSSGSVMGVELCPPLTSLVKVLRPQCAFLCGCIQGIELSYHDWAIFARASSINSHLIRSLTQTVCHAVDPSCPRL
ncbi:hypothetical protein MTR67_039111 [Solanum verrucosum]|uniref:Uncharacterized protein n=1 Tax=Solanum verrucosum TaxID=315347 RepID=A0AAF0UHG2_SOLVR|nr:hypothetical protein MTR67_039111 [Solanum verrucosum]